MYCDTFSIFLLIALFELFTNIVCMASAIKKNGGKKSSGSVLLLTNERKCCHLWNCGVLKTQWRVKRQESTYKTCSACVCVCVLVSSSLCVCNVQLSNNRLISHRVSQSHESEGLDYVSLMLNLFVKFKELESVARLWAPLSGSQVRARILCVGKCYQINQSLV